MCTAISHTGSTCAGLLETLGLTPPCSLPDSFGLPLFDALSTPMTLPLTSEKLGVCNDLSATKGVQLVASASEPYLGSQCAGIVENMYIPSSELIDPLLAPWLPPTIAQRILDSALKSAIQITRIFPTACLSSYRRLGCAALFNEAQPNDALAFLFGTVYLPSFPHRSRCEDYLTECGDTLLLPLLPVNCTSVSPTGLQSYPQGPQVIARVPLGVGWVVDLVSTPNYINSTSAAAISIPTECPYGSTVLSADELSTIQDKETNWVEGTACAVNCPFAGYDEAEYASMYTYLVTGVYIALSFGLLQLVNLSVLKPEKKNVFLVCAVISGFLYQAMLVLQTAYHVDEKVTYCSSDISQYTRSDYSTSAAAGVCVIMAVLGMYQSVFSFWITLAMAGEIWCRVVLGVKKVHKVRRVYMWGSAIWFIIHGILLTVYGDPEVANSGPFCSWAQKDSDLQYFLYTLPCTVYFAASLLLTVHALYICVHTSLKVREAGSNPIRKIWKAYSMLFLFLILELTIFPISIFFYGTKLAYVDSSAYLDSSDEWMLCLYRTFISSADSGYLGTCGDHPAKRVSVAALVVPSLTVNYLSAVFLFIITLNKEARAFWMKLTHLDFALPVLAKHLPWLAKAAECLKTKVAPRMRFFSSAVTTISVESDSSSANKVQKSAFKRVLKMGGSFTARAAKRTSAKYLSEAKVVPTNDSMDSNSTQVIRAIPGTQVLVHAQRDETTHSHNTTERRETKGYETDREDSAGGGEENV
jgi:hypothetical protein